MYTPKPPPDNLTVQALWAELNEIKSVLQTLITDQITFAVQYEEPAKPCDGRVYYADGTTWNPGAGAGPYIYLDSEWWPLIDYQGKERPRPGYLTLTSYAPYVHKGDKIVPVPSGSLTLRGLSIACGGYLKSEETIWDCGSTTWDSGSTVWDTKVIEEPKDASLTLITYAPRVVFNIPYTREIPSGSMNLTGFAPLATHDRVIPITNRNLTLTSSAPTVSVTP